MPFDLQTKLLRVLENSIITKVGSNSEIKLDVRIICATHKKLDELVEHSKFREDLLFRLNVFPIDVPSLSDRFEDIPALLEHFIQRKIKNSSDARPNFDTGAIKALQSYHWPGNIREVRNIVERALVFFPRSQISEEDVKKYLLRINSDVVVRAEEQDTIWSELDKLGDYGTGSEATETEDIDPPSPKDFANWFDRNNSVDLRSLLRDIEIVLIEAALDRNNGNTSEASQDLKLLRTTLIEKIKKYGI
jgi:sigma-54 specific flagellar transcriptional regulator A